VNPSLKNRCFRVLRKVSPTHAVLPKSYFPSGVTLTDTIPYASGGFADIWKGDQDGVQVCVKAFRTQTAVNLDKIKRVCSRSISRQDGRLIPVPIRGSIVRSLGGSTFPIRTCYPSSESRRGSTFHFLTGYPFSETRRSCFRFASSVLGCQTETSPSTSATIGRSIDGSS
jgi:hypothetical protein